MKKMAISSLLLMEFFTCKPVFSSQPFISDDPEIVATHHANIYFSLNYDQVVKNAVMAFPSAEIDYGLWPDIEIDIGSSYTLAHPHQSDEANASGIGDSTIELKFRFLHETLSLPEMAFNPVYNIPTGNAKRNLGNGRPSLLLPIWALKTWDKWILYGGGGYVINPAPALKNHAILGMVLQKNITEKLSLGGEIYSSGTESSMVKFSTLFNIGGTYQMLKTFALQASMGHNILGQRQFIAYAGIVLSV